jgi:cytochrome c553
MNRVLLVTFMAGLGGMAGLAGMAGSAQAAGNAAAGKAAATSCAMCHGAEGEGNQRGPKLAGEDPVKFIQAMDDYKSGKRDSPMMKNLATQLTPGDTADLAAYYASLK